MKSLKVQNGKGKAEESPLRALFPAQAQWMDRWFREAGFPSMPTLKAPVIDISEDDKEVLVKPCSTLMKARTNS
ncbi:MAG: hypothetical protein ABIW76_24245 [Fibrobacteria bacterium]